MQNTTVDVKEKAAVCLAWIEQKTAAVCLAWIKQGESSGAERPTVSLALEDVDAFLN